MDKERTTSGHGVLARSLRAALVALLCSGAPLLASGGEPLRLVTGNGAPFATPRANGFFDLLVAEMFRRIGVQAVVHTHESSARALANADRGEDDGLIARVRGLEAQFPSLVLIPEKIFDNDFIAATLGAKVRTHGWQALDGRQVAFIRGWQIYEKNLAGHGALTRVNDAAQLLELLRRERAEVILFERWQAHWHAREHRLPLRIQEPPLARQEMFAYLHRRHATLAPAAATALAAMKRDGGYQRIFDSTLTMLYPAPPGR